MADRTGNQRTQSDFPYHNGTPVGIGAFGWLALMLSLAAAYAILVLYPFRTFPHTIVPMLVFTVLPLLTLRLVAGAQWHALFRPVGLWQLTQMVVFAALTSAGSIMVALILSHFMEMTANPISSHLTTSSAPKTIWLLLMMIPQLIGEELFGILPFLAVLWICTSRLGLSRGVGITIGLVVSALIFGAIHLPTYNWNWAQALLGIGAARIFLTLAYIATRNLWVSAGAHVLNDWTELGGVILYNTFNDHLGDILR